jgi:hypothetical protein
LLFRIGSLDIHARFEKPLDRGSVAFVSGHAELVRIRGRFVR